VTVGKILSRFPGQLFLMIALLAPALAPAVATTVKDATGREISINDPGRIVSVGGAVTEILYGLGMEKSIVGIDTTSLYPPRAAAEKPSVGYMRQLSAEGVLGLRPTVILAIDGAGPKETISVLQAAKVPLVIVPDRFSGQGIVDKIHVIAKVTGSDSRAHCMIEQVQADLEALAKLRSKIRTQKRVLFVLSLVNGRALVSGKNTAADGVIRLAGGVNAIDEYEGYKPLSDEAASAARPDVVLTMQRGGPGTVTADSLFALPAFAASPAAASHAFISMEGLYLLGFGPRSARAARDLATSLYPALKPDRLPSEREPGNAGICRE
jgi:iron complex transport system substrate-binding protein